MCSTLATVKRQKRLRRNSSDCWLRFGRLSLEKRDFGGGMVMTSEMCSEYLEGGDRLSGVDFGNVEDKALRVARGSEESGVAGDLSQGKGRDLARDLADRHRSDRQDDLARLLVFDHLGLVLQAQVERWKSG